MKETLKNKETVISNINSVMLSLPDWYKALSLLELQLKALQEDIPQEI
jgi:hypothetical protein